MNCKPGLAIITQCPPFPRCIGYVVECTKFVGAHSISGVRYPDVWLLNWRGLEGYACRDSWMRPIRDPGDDARDETLEWLPVPKRETETA